MKFEDKLALSGTHLMIIQSINLHIVFAHLFSNMFKHVIKACTCNVINVTHEFDVNIITKTLNYNNCF